MNKKIYKGYELIKALADKDIEAGTILIFTSTINTANKIEVEVTRKPQGLILYKRNTIDDILPSSWLLNSKIEVLEDNTEEIDIQSIEEIQFPDNTNLRDTRDLIINQLVKAVKKLDKDINYIDD